MQTPLRLRSLAVPVLVALAPACTLVRVGAADDDGPARLELDGLVDGHLAVGISDETDLVDLDLLSGRSDGALAELTVWKLLRLELGLAGATVAVGPLELGLGVLAYHPEPWARDPQGRGAEPEGTPPAPTVEDVGAPGER